MMVTAFNDAEFHLFEVLWSWLPPFPFQYLIGGLSVLVHPLYIPELNVTALYIHKDIYLTTLSTAAMLRVSRIQYGPQLFPYGMLSEQDITDHTFFY